MSFVAMAEADYLAPVEEAVIAEFKSPEEVESHILALQKQMREAAKNFEFEKAGRLRDRIKALKEQELKIL